MSHSRCLPPEAATRFKFHQSQGDSHVRRTCDTRLSVVDFRLILPLAHPGAPVGLVPLELLRVVACGLLRTYERTNVTTDITISFLKTALRRNNSNLYGRTPPPVAMEHQAVLILITQV